MTQNKNLLSSFTGKANLLLLISLFLTGNILVKAQNDVMLQAFYWDVPVDAQNKKGLWWNNLTNKSFDFKNWGITGIWIPSPAKGNWGIYDMGYGIYDHYDLGNYNQKGSIETRFGSRSELENMISAMHDVSQGKPKVNVYADIILNHIYSSDEDAEINPAVKQYVFDEAFRNGQQYVPYPTNEITWVIPNATAGDYFIKFKGYYLDFNASHQSRAYDIQIDYNNSGFNSTYTWETEPNNGGGHYNTFPGSGQTVRAFINYQDDIDEFKVTAPGGKDIIIKLTSRTESGSNWNWGDQTRGYYPFEIWHNGQNLATTQLKAYTNTGLSFPAKTGAGEQNWTWNYTHFHPVDEFDWLGDWGAGDEIITNTKGFGNDLNTFSSIVQQRMNEWGTWLSDVIKFDGYRLDFVRGFQESYAASWINSLPLINGSQRFIVGEYWGSAASIKNWVNNIASYGADTDAFDFPLKATLTDMCNGDANFNMNWLNHAGLIRNNSGNSLPGTSVVTFLENHDTGKEHDKWVTKDWHLGYAYLLTHEGRPCLFYPHLYGVTLLDNHDASHQVNIPGWLQAEIVKLIHVRRTYLNGTISVLSQNGNPYPAANTHDVYVARRQGNGTKDGAIVVINNSTTTKGLWVNATPSGWSNWSNKSLVNAFDNSQTTQVYSDGRVWVEAPARGYAIYVLSTDYTPYDLLKNAVNFELNDELNAEINESEILVYPNPVKKGMPVTVSGNFTGKVNIQLFDSTGRLVGEQTKETLPGQKIQLNAELTSNCFGTYILKINSKDYYTTTLLKYH
ncbi:T9SS type A sorting domain-containing protein [Alkaliflexus imshenetskii]|uniref:T9SS type A sorting domain-containing protein n=1 Tax=Alkaliflexus imshenetskii TaxID=286730 RepID=UPI0004B0A79C|nr:T9SS type A sorting domain-containing protein [Alkaliflexus imshenetskii]